MSTHKIIDAVCILIAILGIIITVLFMNGERFGLKPLVDEDSEGYENSESSNYVTDSDMNDGWDISKATNITMEGSNGTISGSGAYFYEGDLIIGQSGDYIISGNLTDGSITVDAGKKAKVKILLNGVSVSCNDGPALLVKKADKVVVTLAEGTDNEIISGEELSKTAKKKNYDGAITAKDDLTINGDGSLSVNSLRKHGIEAKDSLVIAGGNITVTATEDGIHSKKDISIVNSNVTISSGDDAVVTEKDISIENSNIDIKDCYEGLEGKVVNVYSGNINIIARDDGINARVKGSELSNEACINIYGGTVTIENSTSSDADGLDSNGDIVITGGTLYISLSNFGTNNAIDYGSECGGICTISGGVVIACGSYEMAEGFDSTSLQPSILYGYSKAAKDNTEIILKDEEGQVILSRTVPYSFSAITLSAPELEIGKNYQLIIGDDEADITISEMSASYGDVKSERMPGGFNPGGTKPFDGNRPDWDSTDGNWPDGDRPEWPEGNPPDMEDFPEDFGGPDAVSGDNASNDKISSSEMEINKDHKGERPAIPEDIQNKRDDFNKNVSFNEANEIDEDAENEYDETSDWVAIKDISMETWYILGASLIAVLFGIIVAAAFRRR